MPFGNFILKYGNNTSVLLDSDINTSFNRTFDYAHLSKHNLVIRVPIQDDISLNDLVRMCDFYKNESDDLHIISENIVIVIKSPMIESFTYDDKTKYNNKFTATINIISNYIELYDQPLTFLRKIKLQKIISRINGDY